MVDNEQRYIKQILDEIETHVDELTWELGHAVDFDWPHYKKLAVNRLEKLSKIINGMSESGEIPDEEDWDVELSGRYPG